MYRAGQIVKDTLFLLEESIVDGISTFELDKKAEEYKLLIKLESQRQYI